MDNQSDFKAPDVVWIHKSDLRQFDAHTDHVFDADIFSVENMDCVKFIDSTTAEANTRKAVREALEKVKSGINNNRGKTSFGVVVDCTIADIDDLITQYQDPQPTEASDEHSR